MKDIEELFRLKHKCAIVTGSGGGIGKGIAEALALAGADIVVAELDEQKMKSSVKDLQARTDQQILGIGVDVQKEDQVANMIKQVLNRFGRIDILVNNAGVGVNKQPQDMTLEEWDYNLNVNLRSVFICSKAVYTQMKKQGGGKIINLASLYAVFGVSRLPAYAASKGGVVQLTKSLAIAWAPDNIQVNAIMPGFINTALSLKAKQLRPELAEAVAARTPAGRWGEPEDIGGTAVFLASPASDFITGISVPVDGGYSIMP